ncbi:hypothetical protein Tco_0852581 [Tanacetum coccineum]
MSAILQAISPLLFFKTSRSLTFSTIDNEEEMTTGVGCFPGGKRTQGTDNQEKDEKQRQNDKTGLGMEKTVKDKAKSKPKSQSSQKVNRKVNWSKSKSTQVNPGAKVQEI